MSEHSPEPWKVAGQYSQHADYMTDANGKIICVISNKDAKRVIACVNACQGYTTERLETIVKEGESLLIRFNRLQERLERLEEHWTTHDNPKH